MIFYRILEKFPHYFDHPQLIQYSVLSLSFSKGPDDHQDNAYLRPAGGSSVNCPTCDCQTVIVEASTSTPRSNSTRDEVSMPVMPTGVQTLIPRGRKT